MNIVNSSFFVDYGISHIMSSVFAYCGMFANENFYRNIHNPMLITLLLFVLYMKPKNRNSRSKWQLFCEEYLYVTLGIMSVIIVAYYRVIDDYNVDDLNYLYLDIVMTKLRLRLPTFNTMLYLCKEDLNFIDYETLKTYNQIFVGKFVGIYCYLPFKMVTTTKRDKIKS